MNTFCITKKMRKSWKYGYTDSLLNRPAKCIFSSWHDAQQYLAGYLYGNDVKKEMGI